MTKDEYTQAEDEKFFNEFKEKMVIDPLSESVRHLEQASKRQLITIVVLVVFAVIAGICWNLYSSYIAMKEPVTEITLIKADTSEYRELPENPGGMVVPNQDKTIYERINPASAEIDDIAGQDEPVAAQELPKPISSEVASIKELIEVVETESVSPVQKGSVTEDSNAPANIDELKPIYSPSDRPVVPSEDEAKPLETVAEVANSEEYTALFPAFAPVLEEQKEVKVEAVEEVKTVTAEKDEKKKEPQEVKSEAKTEPEPKTETEPKVKTEDKVIEKIAVVEKKTEDKAEVKTVSAVTAEEKAAPAPKAEPVAKSVEIEEKPAPVQYSEWRVQLLATNDKVSAVKSWGNLYKKHKDLLVKYGYEVADGTSGGKTIYRLRVRDFADRAEADKLCSSLKSRKQDCLVVKK